MKRYILFVLSIFMLVGQGHTYQHEISICAIFQNEGRFLKEWIEYHRLIGVEKFYLYNNNSTDDFDEILKPYIKNRIVELIDWPYSHHDNNIVEWNNIQSLAYQDALHRATKRTKWLAIIDLDEFIVIKSGRNLAKVLKEFEAHSGVGVNWQMFGTSGVEEIPPGKLMIEMLVQRALKNHPEHLTIKSIVRPEKVLTCTNPHFVHYAKGECVTTDHVPFKGAFSPKISTNKIQINHYWLRDRAYMLAVKYPRVQKVNSAAALDWLEAKDVEFSQETDLSILPWVPKLRKAMGF